jgi:hypothetical protein
MLKILSPRINRQADLFLVYRHVGCHSSLLLLWKQNCMCILYIHHGVGILLKKCINENCTFFENLLLDKILEPSEVFEAACHSKLFRIQFLRHKQTRTHTRARARAHTHTHIRTHTRTRTRTHTHTHTHKHTYRSVFLQPTLAVRNSAFPYALFL